MSALAVSGAAPSHPVPREDSRGVSAKSEVARLNAALASRGAPWRAAVTPLSSLDAAEFARAFPPLPPLPEDARRRLPVIEALPGEVFPPAWDWREMNGVTPVRNQHVPLRCGSCYAFAACAELESFIKIYDGREEDLSEQQVLSCHNPITPPAGGPGFGGCLGASADRPYNLFMDPGAVSETCMVYEALDDEVPCIEDGCAIHGRISGYSIVAAGESSLKHALLTGPVWVGMYIDNDFRSYGTGCFTFVDPPLPMPDVNHAMLCVGWIDSLCGGAGAWIVKNSFGTEWGDAGYGYIRYGTETFAEYAYQIRYVPGPVKALSLEEPDGAEIWAVGSRHEIEWHCAALPVDHFEIGCRVGASYHVIDDRVGLAARRYAWTVSDGPGEDCRIEIAAHDASDRVIASDASDAPFAVVTPRTDWDVEGVEACVAGTWQGAPRMASDYLGGAIVVWQDLRNGNNDFYGQRFDVDGNRLWSPNGLAICTEPHHQRNCDLACSGAAAFVVWEDERNAVPDSVPPHGTDIYGREIRLDGDENPSNGEIKVCCLATDQSNPRIVADAFGGAIAVWEDFRSGRSECDLYAQRLHPGGAFAWATNGVPVCTSAGAQREQQIVSDGTGGAIVAWEDTRDGVVDIYVQRIADDGRVKWGAAGLPICGTPASKDLQGLVTDGQGGAIAVWVEEGAGSGLDIHAQRVSRWGDILWGLGGVVVCDAPEDQCQVDVAPDGLGGAVVAWCDNRGEWVGEIPKNLSTGVEDIRAQRIGGSGSVRWNEVGVCTLPRTQEMPRVVPDGAGGAVVIWRDKRDSGWIDVGENALGVDENDFDLYFQRIDVHGEAMWRANGEPLCAEPTEQMGVCAAPDSIGGVYVAWNDTRGGLRESFVQRLSAYHPHPRCAVTAAIVRGGAAHPISGERLFACPAGDGGDTLLVRCDFRDGDMDGRAAVAPQEIVLDAGGLGFTLCGSSTRDTAGTAANGYRVTLARACVAGCSDCEGGGCAEATKLPQDIAVSYGGAIIGSIAGLRVKGIDVDGDGFVDAIENERLGRLLGKTPADSAYSSAYDYDADGAIDERDLRLLGAHCAHRCPNFDPRPGTAAITPRFVLEAAAEGDTSRTRSVRVYLDRIGDVSSACFGLGNESQTLAYRGWIPRVESGVATNVVTVVRDGRPVVFVSARGLPSGAAGAVEIGTLAYEAVGGKESVGEGSGSAAGSDGFALVFGEAITRSGVASSFSRSEYEEEGVACPSYLATCCPNPFNPATTIRYSIAERGRVTIRIYDVSGRLVRTLLDEVRGTSPSGHEAVWRGDNDAGHALASGVYFCRLETKGFTATRKIVILR